MNRTESAVYAASNVPAWAGAGVVLDTDGKQGLTVAQALEHSGLDWEVKKVPISGTWDGNTVPVDGRWGVQRQTDGKILGVVGSTWQPVQNRSGFGTLQALLEQAGGEMWIESAGALHGGKQVWMLARCPQSLQIAGESYHSHVGFVNGHDGRTSVTAFMSDMRTSCSNFLTYILNGTSLRSLTVRVRHTINAGDKITAAHRLLNLRNARLEELAVQGEWLVEQTMSDSAFELFLESLLPIEEGKEATPAGTMITKRREQIQDLYMTAENLTPTRGTKWGALQAVTEYADHGRATRDESALAKTQFGLTPSPLKQVAYRLLTPRA